MKWDLKRRETKIRVDDDRQRMLVETAQEMIYEHSVRPGADNILELLGSKALMPSWVSYQCFLILSASLFHVSAIQMLKVASR
jgi:hypothetical protein